MMDFQDLHTDLSCMRDLTGRKERTSAMSSEGKVTGDALGGHRERDRERRSMSPFSIINLPLENESIFRLLS